MVIMNRYDWLKLKFPEALIKFLQYKGILGPKVWELLH